LKKGHPSKRGGVVGGNWASARTGREKRDQGTRAHPKGAVANGI